jgi:4-carboxymuconolactone decarboxylase
MARIHGARANQGGPLRRVFVGTLYWMTKGRLGRLIQPVQVTAHHPTILWGYGLMEQSQASAKLVSPKLKGLAELRAATLIGCPF